jgi:hypothetical protein
LLLLATGSGHESYQFFIHVLRLKDAPPPYVQAIIYKLTADFFGVGGWKVEGIIHEMELSNPSFPPVSDPFDNRLGRMTERASEIAPFSQEVVRMQKMLKERQKVTANSNIYYVIHPPTAGWLKYATEGSSDARIKKRCHPVE